MTGECRLDPGDWQLDPGAWRLFRCNPGDPMQTKRLILATLLSYSADWVTSAIARSYRQYQRGVSSDIGDCGVGITPQMCNRVTNHGDMSTFSKPGHSQGPVWKTGIRITLRGTAISADYI